MKVSDVLAELDALARRSAFPGFDDGSYATVDARMHLYRSASSWALLIEEAVDWLGPGGPRVIVFGAGPGLVGEPGLIDVVSTQLEVAIDEDFVVTSATLRGDAVDLTETHRIALDEDVETPCSLLVDLARRRRDDLFFRTSELASLVRPELERILRIEAWRHPDVYGGELPSESEAFALVAAVLETGAIHAWAPRETPNSGDWKYWREEK